ncbi:hypothetical protein KR018_005928 [Drosophila ironensis]|nr:hypothetical protein KR018_005928 [Drosophila ironensis]
MSLSRKEIVSVLLFLAAMLSLLNAVIFANIFALHVSWEQLFHQVVCVGTAYICLVYSASTYFYHSNYSRARQHMRYVLVAMLIILCVCNCVSLAYFIDFTNFEVLQKSTDIKSFLSSFETTCVPICIVLTVASILLMIFVLLMVIRTINRKNKQRYRLKTAAEGRPMAT